MLFNFREHRNLIAASLLKITRQLSRLFQKVFVCVKSSVCVCVLEKLKLSWRFETFRLVGIILILLQSFFVFTINLVYCTKNSLLLCGCKLFAGILFSLQPKVCFIRVTLKSVKSVYLRSFTIIQTIASFCFNCMCVCVLWFRFLLFQ